LINIAWRPIPPATHVELTPYVPSSASVGARSRRPAWPYVRAIRERLSPAAVLASERTDGWTRQLRITPLTTSAYFRVKVLTGYAMAGLTIALLYGAGVSLGVSLPAERWLEMTGLILVALVPFAACLLRCATSWSPRGPGVTALPSPSAGPPKMARR
jgi:hypothetical protein